MSDDLIEDAISCLRGEGWDKEADAVVGLVAEVKRLRKENDCLRNGTCVESEKISQADSYLEELENAFLDAKKGELYFREYSKRGDITLPDAYDRAKKEARDALDKIRVSR
jgi:hypothetical protein